MDWLKRMTKIVKSPIDGVYWVHDFSEERMKIYGPCSSEKEAKQYIRKQLKKNFNKKSSIIN